MSFIRKIFHFLSILRTIDLISNIQNSSYIKYNPSQMSRIFYSIKAWFENIAFIWKISSSANKVMPKRRSSNFQGTRHRRIGCQKRYKNRNKVARGFSFIALFAPLRYFNLNYVLNRKVFYTGFVSLLILGTVFIGYGYFTSPHIERDDDENKNKSESNIDNANNRYIAKNNGNIYSGLSLNFDEQIEMQPESNAQNDKDMLISDYNRRLESSASIIIEEGDADIIEEGMPEIEKNEKIVEYINYKIKSGDTISQLAHSHGISEDAMFSANVNVNSKALKIGDTLRIPNKNGLTYKIRRNDTLSDIAVLFDTTVAKIVQENELKNSTIYPDTELFISSGRLTEEAKLRILGIELINPVRGYLTSKYGFRIHPIYKTKLHHNGIDIAGNNGQNIVAAQSGTVTFAGWSGGYGYQIKIKHQGGLTTTYAHLASMNVKRGQSVKRGQTIGKVGSTGNVTGAHLHFEVLLNGKFVNPRLYVTY